MWADIYQISLCPEMLFIFLFKKGFPPFHQGVALGPCTSLHWPSTFTPSPAALLSLTAPSSILSPTPIFLNPHLPTAHAVPTATVPRIPVGASTHPTPLTTPPNAVAPTAATILPTSAYFAYRTTRQKIKIPIYRKERRRARVRRCAGRGELGELGELGAKRKWMFCFAECRAELDLMFARCSVAASEEEDKSVSEDPLDGDIFASEYLQLKFARIS
jgi:hypothetical protein